MAHRCILSAARPCCAIFDPKDSTMAGPKRTKLAINALKCVDTSAVYAFIPEVGCKGAPAVVSAVGTVTTHRFSVKSIMFSMKSKRHSANDGFLIAIVQQLVKLRWGLLYTYGHSTNPGQVFLQLTAQATSLRNVMEIKLLWECLLTHVDFVLQFGAGTGGGATTITPARLSATLTQTRGKLSCTQRFRWSSLGD